MERTSIGLVLRATAQNRVSAELVGIPIDLTVGVGWGLACALGTIAGILAAPVAFLEPGMMINLMPSALSAITLGGLTSPVGALVGVFEKLVGNYVGFIGQDLKVPVVLLLMFWLCWNLLHGRVGRAMTAMRNHEVAAATSGVNIALYKLLAFAFGSMFAAVGGAVLVLVTQFANPDSFSLVLAITFLTGRIIGGIDSAVGAVLGALFMEFVPVVTSDLAMAHDFPPAIIYAIVLVAVIFLMTDGLVGLTSRLRRRKPSVSPAGGTDRAALTVGSMQAELVSQ